MEIDIARQESANGVVLRVVGEVDVHTAPVLDQAIDAEDAAAALAVDLTGVQFLDSSGLGVLIKGLTRARNNGGSLVIVANTEPVLKPFRVTRLIDQFTVVDSLDRI